MIAGLKPYPEYKDTSIPWLGQMPEHWSKCRIKSVLQEMDNRSSDGSGTLLSLSRARGLIRQSDMTDKAPSAKNLIGYKHYQPGQIVMNRMQAWSGMFGAGPIEGLVSPDYAVFRVLGGHETKLILERLKAPDLVSQFALESKGIGSGFNRLYTDRFGSIPITLPPLGEQRTIVRFLTWAISRMDHIIRAKRKIIALLNEQKQAIIHRVVTHGLDSVVQLKPSGIAGLGDIPQHWEQPLNQAIFRETIRQYSGGSEVPLSLSQRDGLIPTDDMKERSLRTASYDGWKIVLPGDLVLNRFKAHLGVFFSATSRGMVSFHYGVFAPKAIVNTKYYELLYHTSPFRTIYAGRSNGMTVGLQNLSNQNFYNVRTIVPPIKEQSEIVKYVEKVNNPTNHTIQQQEQAISFLSEYRARLISDVVTGKLDVREFVAHLPTVTQPSLKMDMFAIEDSSLDQELDDEEAEE